MLEMMYTMVVSYTDFIKGTAIHDDDLSLL